MTRLFPARITNNIKQSRLPILFVAVMLLTACDHPGTVNSKGIQSSSIAAAVNHPARPQSDITRDSIRSPEKVLEFFDIKQGETVVEVLAANGYYVELLSRCVGESGTIYMQNNQKFYDFQTEKNVVERLADNRLKNVVRWDKELTDLQFAENSLDKLLMILVLHDLYWMESDVNQVLQEIYKSLKPGGVLGIIDHAAKEGSGMQHAIEMKGLHRIDKKFVITTMLANGFLLDAESNSLKNPEDDRSKAFFSPDLKGKPTDRFMLRFKKPDAN